MDSSQQQLEALNDIRQMMKQSSRFISLSGLSGIFAGIYALIGAWLGHSILSIYFSALRLGEPKIMAYNHLLVQGFFICAAVLGLSLATAFYFSSRRARAMGQKMFDHTALRLLINLAVPLAAGGAFCLAMLYHGDERALLVAPGMLIFYGLSLVNGSKYTLHDIRYLGYLEIILGVVCCFFPKFGLLFWALGFGALHVIYGTLMWFKYERRADA